MEKSEIIKKMIDELMFDEVGGILAVGATDTIKKVGRELATKYA